jgi:hypothetical protein
MYGMSLVEEEVHKGAAAEEKDAPAAAAAEDAHGDEDGDAPGVGGLVSSATLSSLLSCFQ